MRHTQVFNILVTLADHNIPLADADCPKIITRGEWRAKDGKNVSNFTTPLSHVMIHQTVTWPCHTVTRCSADVRGIQKNHMNILGLDDIGYS